MLLALVLRLIDVQVFRSAQYQAAGNSELTTVVNVPALRASLYAADGEPLAMSVPTEDVYADDFQIHHPLQEATAMAPLLHLAPATLAAEMQRRSGFVALAKQVSLANEKKIAADAFPGITFVPDATRTVPNGSLASPLLGFTNAAGEGAAGLENQFNSLLAGTVEQLQAARVANRRCHSPDRHQDPFGHDGWHRGRTHHRRVDAVRNRTGPGQRDCGQ